MHELNGGKDYATDAEVLQALSSQVPPPALDVFRDFALTAGANGTPAPLRRVLGEIVSQWAAMQVVSQGIASGEIRPQRLDADAPVEDVPRMRGMSATIAASVTGVRNPHCEECGSMRVTDVAWNGEECSGFCTSCGGQRRGIVFK